MSEFDRKYRSAFGGRSWYDEMAYQWEERGGDDDCLRTVIEASLDDLAAAEGLLLPNELCGGCECDLPETTEHTRACPEWFGRRRACFTCAEEMDVARERDELLEIARSLEWLRMTPAERTAYWTELRFMMGGLIARDVQ